MVKLNAKKINLILLNIIIAFAIIFSNCITYAAPSSEEDVRIDKEIKDHYTIEDIIYNKVPIFDINVFSSTSGGKAISENSIEGILKKTVATWYVSIRNVTFVVIAILIIYNGMMMAISTAAEEKARYKMNLVGWTKGIVAAAFIHIIIFVVISLNETMVETISNITTSNTGNEISIYNTIRTRALDSRLSIGIPATIIYLILLVMWLRFLWTYTKRKFNVEFLIILAPLVVAKYTYEVSSGKKSKLLTNWFQRFSTAVFIQSIHALFYKGFVGIVMQISVRDLTGFILALIILSFMLSADKIFTNIFRFNFSGADIDDLNRPFRFRENFAGMFVTYGVMKRVVPQQFTFFRNTSVAIKDSVDKAIEDKYGIDGPQKGILSIPRRASNFIDSKIEKLPELENKDAFNTPNIPVAKTLVTGLNKGISLGVKGLNKVGVGKATRDGAVLRIMSRKRGSIGITSRRTLKLKRKENWRKFTGNMKFIKDVTVGGAEVILAIPIAVNYGGEAGLATITYAMNNIEEAVHLGSKEQRKADKKASKSLDNIVDSVETVYEETENISDKTEEISEAEIKEQEEENANEKKEKLSEEEKDEIRDKTKDEIRSKIREYTKLKMDRYTINNIVDNQPSSVKSQATNAQSSERVMAAVEKIVENVTSQLPESVTEEQKKEIKEEAIRILKTKNAVNYDERNAKKAEATQNNYTRDYDDRIETDDKRENGRRKEKREQKENRYAQETDTQEEKREQTENRYAQGIDTQEDNEHENKDSNERQSWGYKKHDYKEETHRNYSIDEITDAINGAVINFSFGEKYEDIGKSVEKISSANSKEVAKKDSFGKLIDMNHFADTL